jgi:CheY-like chemotaxis protein
VPVERRQDVRHPILLEVNWPEVASAPDCTEDLSTSGLFVRTERRFPIGTPVPVELSFPGLLDALRIPATVVRAQEPSGARRGGLGMRFAQRGPEPLRALIRAAEAGGPRRRYRILLVEDSALVATMYAEALRRLAAQAGWNGLEVETAENGHRALVRLRLQPSIDLVMTDVHMPAMDGLALLSAIRGDRALARTPVVVITSGAEAAGERPGPQGAQFYLRKPVTYRDIVATVRTLLTAAVAAEPPAA